MGVNGNNPKTVKKARKFQPTVGSDGITDWMQCNGDSLIRAVAAVARSGGAIRLGYTRDGGAYSIGVYGDGEPYTIYVRPHEDISKIFDEMAETFNDAT